MPIDLGQVDWLYVAVLAVFAFAANVVANLLSFKRRGIAAILAAVFFRSDIRILDLLPARLAASDVDSGSEVSGHRRRAGRPRHPAKAEQSDHGRLAAPAEHFAIGIHPTVLLTP
jgi:hypothetical protein